MTIVTVPAWAGEDLVELLTLDQSAPGWFRNRCGDRNAHDRTYGGQLLGQALMAAAAAVPTDRQVTALQFLFLQGAIPDQAIDFEVTALQDGRRFCSRHVRASQATTQGGRRMIFDAQLTFAVPLAAPAHSAPPDPATLVDEDPLTMPRLTDLPQAWADEIDSVLSYSLVERPSVAMRLPNPPEGLRLQLPEPRLRFWLKAAHALPENPHLHAGAFAYLSDWWLNFPALGAHIPQLQGTPGLYVASLNHAIWFHQPFRADEWLHFDCHSPRAADGRGLTVARIHNRHGVLVASATQECLMAPRDA